MNMPGIGGLQLVKYMSQHYEAIPVLVITGYPDVNDAVEVMKLGATEYLVKPFLYEELKDVLGSMLPTESKDKTEQISTVGDSFHGIIGRSEPMQNMFRLIDKTKNNLATVLITGESGTGQNLNPLI